MIDITCPVTLKGFAEYHWGDDISSLTDAHMKEHHPDWLKVRTLQYFPKGGARCPACPAVYDKMVNIDKHMRGNHPEYKRLDELFYVLREVA